MSDRVWVTGLGLTTALGIGVEPTWSALVRGERAIRPLELFDVGTQRVGIGAEVRGLPWPASPERGLSRTAVMALLAAEEALGGARLAPSRSRVGLIVGCTTGGLFETEELLGRLHARQDLDRIEALLAYPLTGPAHWVDRRLGPFARLRTISSACSSGATAILLGATWLLSGELDAVVAGGCDGLCRLTLSGFNALAALDPEPCRPFDRRRRGTSLGEGAGFVVLERRRDARARGVDPIAELAGWASGGEAYHVTNPEPQGHRVARLLGAAMARADLVPSDIDYVSAHGTGTRANDAAEAAALHQAFGEQIRRVPVSSSKAQLGHTLGASGAIEAAITALVVSRGVLVPTAGLEEPDPDLGLAHVAQQGRPVAAVRAALSNAFGFGGMDTVLAFRSARSEGDRVAAARTHRVVVTGGALAVTAGSCGIEGCAERTAPGAVASTSVRAADLDPARSRRFDGVARLAAMAAERALGDAAAPADGTGVLLGTALGPIEAAAAFMHRVAVRGPRQASPADFPVLLPSTSVGHVSTYAQLTGPVFAPADPWTCGESAVVEAIGLVGAGEARRILAGASDEHAGALAEVLVRVSDSDALRREGRESAALVLLEQEAEALARGGRVLARVEHVLQWQGTPDQGLLRVPAPAPGASEVFVSRRDALVEAALAKSAWGACRRWPDADTQGSLGASAFVTAVARLAAGIVGSALVVASTLHGGQAIVLVGHDAGRARA